MCAAGEEVSFVSSTLEQEAPTGADPINGDDHTLVFRQVRGAARFEDAQFDFTHPQRRDRDGLDQPARSAAAIYQCGSSSTNSQATGYTTPGRPTDLKEIETHHLRMSIYVLDRPSFRGR